MKRRRLTQESVPNAKDDLDTYRECPIFSKGVNYEQELIKLAPNVANPKNYSQTDDDEASFSKVFDLLEIINSGQVTDL